jgi:hypothetical protein
MSYANPIWLEGRRKYRTRPEAYRFAAPGSPEAKMPGYLYPWAADARAEEVAQDEARARAAAEQDTFERELLALRHDFAKLKLEYELRRFQQKYSPDQPRAPAGSREGGQWTSGGGAAQSTDIGAARKLPTIVKEFGKWTARQYVSRYCEAKVNRELPGEFENMTIADIWNLARGGDARARTCMKLMRPRFGK